MSDSFYKRLSNMAGLLALTSIVALFVFVANIEIKDLDLWLHLGMGRHIVENGFRVPSVDMLSCTIPGNFWNNHEWLFQVLVYHVQRIWDFDGIINLQVFLVTLTMGLLLLMGYSKEKQLPSIFMLLLLSLVYHGRFTHRPDLFSLLFFTLYIFIMSFYIDKKWSIGALFVVQLLWTNMHGFFFFGPLFVIIALSAEWLKRHVKLPYEWNEVGRLTDDEYKRLKLILGVVVVACLFNPLGAKGAWYPISVFFQISGESKIFFDKIVELKRPISLNTLFSMQHYVFYKLLILLSFISFIYNREKIDIGSLFFWLIFLFFSLAAIRNLVFFAFTAYLVFLTNIMSLELEDILPMEITDKKFIYLMSFFVKVFLIVWVLQYGAEVSLNGYWDYDKYERKSEYTGVSQRNYPNKAVDFLNENNVSGNFFNDFNTGAYLVGRCSPDIKVFIDGRTEVYGPEFFKYYQQAWEKGNKEVLIEALEKYEITGAILSSVYQPIPVHALKYFYESEEWFPVYFNYDALVFLKDVPKNKEVIEKFSFELADWRPERLDLYRIGAKKVSPYHNINRAYTLESMDLDEAALVEIEDALLMAPNVLEPYKIRGKIYAKKKEFQKAFENFRVAVMFSSGDPKLRLNLARSYYDLEKYEYSQKEYQKIINSNPKDPQAYFLLTRVFVKQKEYDRATNLLHQAFALDPKAIKDVLAIGDLILEEKEYDRAKEVYSLALNSEKKKDKVFLKMGLLYKKMGDLVKAQEEFQKGLEANKENEEIIEAIKNINVVEEDDPQEEESLE